MTRLHPTAAALIVPGARHCRAARRTSDLPNQLAPSRMTTIGVNSYLWRAALDTCPSRRCSRPTPTAA